MPLFFVISGFVFYLTKSYKIFKVKVLDFAIIYVVWCTLMWLSKFLMAKDVNNPVSIIDLFLIVYRPIMVYWYLYVLIFMYIVSSVLKLEEIDGKVLGLAAIVAIGTRLVNLDVGMVNSFLYHMYFFLAGGYCLRSNLVYKLKFREFSLISVLLILNCVLFFYYEPSLYAVKVVKDFIVANIASVFCFYVFARIKPDKLFVLMGVNTLQIYVMHCFFTGGIRVLFKYLAVSNIYLYFFVATLLGILVPIATSFVCRRIYWMNIVFEPIKTIKRLGGIQGKCA